MFELILFTHDPSFRQEEIVVGGVFWRRHRSISIDDFGKVFIKMIIYPIKSIVLRLKLYLISIIIKLVH